MAFAQMVLRCRALNIASAARQRLSLSNPKTISHRNMSYLSTCSRARLRLSSFSHPRVTVSVQLRSFKTFPCLRNDAYIPKNITGHPMAPPPTQTGPSPAPAPPNTPPPKSRLSFLRRLPWKTIIIVSGVIYLLSLAEDSVMGGMLAVLEQFTVPDNTWLYLNLNDLHITESPHSERALQILPFVSSAGKRRMTVLELIATLEAAAADPRVKGLILAFNDSMIEHRAILTGEVIESSLGMGAMMEIQNAIGYFRMAKRAQRMQEKGEDEVVEPPFMHFDPPRGPKPVWIGQPLPPYHPSQDVVIAISDKYSNGFDYALASCASRIFLQPTGQVELTGLSIQQLFFGNVLKKYGVDFKVEARREFKSALASVSGTGWNQPTRENLEDLMWSLQAHTILDLEQRKIPLDQRIPKHFRGPVSKGETPGLWEIYGVSEFIREKQRENVKSLQPYLDALQQGPWSADEALRMGVIDNMGYHHVLLDELKRSGIKTWSARKYADAALIYAILGRYDMSMLVLPQLFGRKTKKEHTMIQPGPPHVTFHLDVSLDAEGKPDIDNGSLKYDLVVPRTVGLIYLDTAIEGKGKFGGEATAAYILKAARDKNIHSIVLRINSPGGINPVTCLMPGDAIASDTIWRAVQVARQSKPVVASLGDVAASGGYYIAAGADAIVSNPATITGSIGVIAGWPVIRRLLDMVDVTSDSIQSTPNAAWRHMELGLPESEMKKLSAHIDETYETFKTVVSKGRSMPMGRVEVLARGQVFTGAQAVRLGLVDKLGGLNEALHLAGKLSLGKENWRDHEGLRQQMTPEMRALFDDALVGGEKMQGLIRDSLKSNQYRGEEPDPEKVSALVKRMTSSVRPHISTVIIPHINLANEAFGAALASAFQTDDERSPIPVDQPTEMGDVNARASLVVGALLGIAQSNNIPWWQLPAFCYWYASQATGKIGTDSATAGLLHTWFSRIMSDGGVYKGTSRKPRVFAGGETAWDIRMELPPFEILF